MTLAASLTTDSSLFVDTDDFGETVTYYPRNFFGQASRSSRSISAVVIREQLQGLAQDGGDAVVPRFEVHVRNDSTYGISSDELDLGGDQIGFPVRDGKTAEKRSITRLITQDTGMLVLECL